MLEIETTILLSLKQELIKHILLILNKNVSTCTVQLHVTLRLNPKFSNYCQMLEFHNGSYCESNNTPVSFKTLQPGLVLLLTPMSLELSTWTETLVAFMPFTQLNVMLLVLFLSSSPDSQKVSVEPSVRLPIMAGRLEVLMSTTLVRSFKQVTRQRSCKNTHFLLVSQMDSR